MLALAYSIPVLACMVMYAVLGFGTDWTSYAVVAGCGWTLTALCHQVCRSAMAHRTEYTGSYLTSIYHEKAWTERVPCTQIEHDAQGKPHTTNGTDLYTHPCRYYALTQRGTSLNISEALFNQVRDTWARPRTDDQWSALCIQGGTRFGCHYQRGESDAFFPITEAIHYTSRRQGLGAILRYGYIQESKALEEGLIEYPAIDDMHDAPTLCSNDFAVPTDADTAYRRFNAIVAPRHHMRVYLLLYDARRHGTEVVARQQAFWHGGGKNELVVCLGVDDNTVQWSQAFASTHCPELLKAIGQWFEQPSQPQPWHKQLLSFLPWLEQRLSLWPACALDTLPITHRGLSHRQQCTVSAAAFIGTVGPLTFFLLS